MLNRIPFRRGFGSSGTIILGALISAFKLSGHQIKKDTLLKLAVEIETHIDNLAASLYGGFVFGFSEKDKIVTYKMSPPKDMRVVAYIPESELSTSDARNVLPSKVPIGDAVYNLCSFGFLCTAFSSGNLELLKYGTRDKLHQTYRGELMGYLEKLTRLNSKSLLGACLSGAGPSVIFFTQKKMQESAVKEVEDKIKEDQLKGEVKLFATGGKTVWKVLT
jgi:homoserine kinase